MTKVSMFGKFSPAEGKSEEMDAALAVVVAAIEPWDGTEAYSYHRAEDGTYRFYALFTDMDAMQRHGQTEGMQAAMPAFMAALAGPPEMAITTPIAAAGSDA